MKSLKRPRSGRARAQLGAGTYSLSRAKTYLGRLADKAFKGEPVYIVRGQQRFILQHVPEFEPIPMRPPGFFAGCYTAAEIAADNGLAKASAVQPPQDLE